MNIPGWVDDLMDNPIVKWIVIVILVIAVVITAVIALGLGSALLFFFLVGLVIYFGSIRILAGSVIVGALLKSTSSTLAPFALIVFPGSGTVEFFALVQRTGYFNLISCIFLIVFTIRFVTGSIKLIESKTTVNNNFPKQEEE